MMNRFTRIKKKITHQTRSLNLPISSQENVLKIDLGSQYTKIYQGKKTIFNEATAIVCHRSSGEVVEIGNKASKMVDHLTDNFQIFFPIKAARIADDEALIKFINTILKEKKVKGQGFFRQVDAVCYYPASLSPFDQEIYRQTLVKSGLGKVRFIEKEKKIFDFLKKKRGQGIRQIFILEIGAEVSHLSLINEGVVIVSQTLMIGAKDLIESIQRKVRLSFGLEISQAVAQDVVAELVDLFSKNKQADERRRVVKGQNLKKNIAQSITLSQEDIRQPVKKFKKNLIQDILFIFSKLKAEKTVKTIDYGLYLTGGGSQTKGLSAYLEQELKSEIVLAKNPGREII